MGFRENLKTEMAYQDIRTKDLADKSGVQKRTIDHYLMNNPQEPSVTNAFKIAQALNVSVEYLMTGKELQGKVPLTKELIDFINSYLMLNSKKQAAIKEMVSLLTE